MKKMLKTIIKINLVFLLIAPNVTFAQCDKPVTHVKEGEIVPCTGYLFTPEKEKEIYHKLEDAKILKEIDELQERRNAEMQKTLNEYIDYSRQLEKRQQRSEWVKVGYFVSGVVLSYYMFKVTKNEWNK